MLISKLFPFLVINKLTQILSYLRAGNRNKKKKKDRYINETIEKSNENHVKQANTVNPANKANDIAIYEDIGDYEPTLKKDKDRRDRDRDRDRRHDRDRRDRDRDHNRERDHHRRSDRDRRDRDHDHRSSKAGGSSRYFEKDEKDDLHTGYSGEDKEL